MNDSCPIGYTGRKEDEMRITKGRISFVREFVQDGITFQWFVGIKDRKVSSNRSYINYENGLSVIADYYIDRLPKCVQEFVCEHERVFERNVYGVKQYIYK